MYGRYWLGVVEFFVIIAQTLFNIEVKGVLFLLYSLYSLKVFLFSIGVSLILSIESCMDDSGHDNLVYV